MTRPKINPFDWITVGRSPGVAAVVSKVYGAGQDADVEVVYLQGDKEIYEDIKFTGNGWEFPHQGPSGGYARGKDRLAPFVAQLRGGRGRG